MEVRVLDGARAGAHTGGVSVVITGELPAPVLAWREERSRLGLDRFDEVWEGVLHMVPGPTGAHADVDASVLLAIGPLARAVGLRVRTATNLGRADDYRIPDGMLVRTRSTGTYVDTAALVVEVLSPGDETFAKFAFYAAHGVDEVLVADPAAQRVRWWQLRDGAYAETGRSDLLGTTAEEVAEQVDWP